MHTISPAEAEQILRNTLRRAALARRAEALGRATAVEREAILAEVEREVEAEAQL